MNFKDYLRFYRIINWKNKISGTRSFSYSVLGFLMAGNFNILIFSLNSVAVIGLSMFTFSLNDYFDWKTLKERNFLSNKIKEKKLSEKQVLFYIFLPLFLFLPLITIGFISHLSVYLFVILFILILLYTLPIVRLKKFKILGFLVSPFTVLLIFLQSYFIFGKINLSIVFLTILIFLFHCYLETLHVLEDSLFKDEITRINNKQSLKLIKILPLIYFIFSVIFSFYNLIFLVSVCFSLIRIISLVKLRKLIYLNKLTVLKIQSIRRNFFSLQLSLYEFLIYGVLGFFYFFNYFLI